MASLVLQRARRFLGIGVLNTTVDIVLFALLEPHLGLIPATLASTAVSMTMSFVLNAFFAFGAAGLTWRAAVTFFAPTAVNMWVIQPLVIAGLYQVARALDGHPYLDALAAKLAATGVSLVINFVVYDRYVWPRTSHPSSDGSVTVESAVRTGPSASQ